MSHTLCASSLGASSNLSLQSQLMGLTQTALTLFSTSPSGSSRLTPRHKKEHLSIRPNLLASFHACADTRTTGFQGRTKKRPRCLSLRPSSTLPEGTIHGLIYWSWNPIQSGCGVCWRYGPALFAGVHGFSTTSILMALRGPSVANGCDRSAHVVGTRPFIWGPRPTWSVVRSQMLYASHLLSYSSDSL